jgi:hypothetical protein
MGTTSLQSTIYLRRSAYETDAIRTSLGLYVARRSHEQNKNKYWVSNLQSVHHSISSISTVA